MNTFNRLIAALGIAGFATACAGRLHPLAHHESANAPASRVYDPNDRKFEWKKEDRRVNSPY